MDGVVPYVVISSFSYVGITKRTAAEEAFRFLTERGPNLMNNQSRAKKKQRNKPILVSGGQ